MTQNSNITAEPRAPGKMNRRAFAAAGIATTTAFTSSGTAEAAKPGEIDRLIAEHGERLIAAHEAEADHKAIHEATTQSFGKMTIRGPLSELHVGFDQPGVGYEINEQFKMAFTYLGRPASSAERQTTAADLEAYQSARMAHSEATGCKAASIRCDEIRDAEQVALEALIMTRPTTLEEANRKAAYVAENLEFFFDRDHFRWIIASLISPIPYPGDED